MPRTCASCMSAFEHVSSASRSAWLAMDAPHSQCCQVPPKVRSRTFSGVAPAQKMSLTPSNPSPRTSPIPKCKAAWRRCPALHTRSWGVWDAREACGPQGLRPHGGSARHLASAKRRRRAAPAEDPGQGPNVGPALCRSSSTLGVCQVPQGVTG